MIRNLRTHTHTNREVLPVLKWCGTMSCGERAGKLDVEHFGLKYERIPYKFLQILQDFSMYLRLMLQGIAFAFVATLASTFEFHSLVIDCVDLVAQYIGECSSLQWVALSAFGTLLLVWFLLLRPLLTREGCMEQYSQSKKPLLTRRCFAFLTFRGVCFTVAVVTMFQVSVPKTVMQIFVLSASVAIAEVSDEQDLVFLRSTCKFSFTEGWCFDVCRYFLKSNAIPKPLLQNAF